MIKEDMARLEGKVDMILLNQTESRAIQAAHDNRIRSLEKTRSRLLGWLAGVGALLSAGYAAKDSL